MLHLFLLISNLPECLFSRRGVPLCQFHPRFCSPMTALSAEMTSSELSEDISQAKAKTQHCTLLFTPHGLFLSSLNFHDCCLLPSHGCCEGFSLSSSWLGISTSLWPCYCHLPFWLPSLCGFFKNFFFVRWSPKVGLILPDFIQIQETVLHLSY